MKTQETQAMKPKQKKSEKISRREKAAFRHFGLKTDPFTTLALQPHNLDYFVGREALIDRLSSAMFSLSNSGLAGEPGAGKSSLMQLLRSRLPSSYHRVAIGVPLDDAAYFLSELLREMLVVIPPVPGLNFKDIDRRLGNGELNKNSIFSIIRSITVKLK